MKRLVGGICPPGHRPMRSILLFAMAALLLAGTLSGVIERIESGRAPAPKQEAPAAEKPLAPTATAAPATMTVASDRSGHYRVEGSINGRRLDFLVDTGATVIALTARHAGRLGIDPAPRDYVVPVRTANGTLKAAEVRLSSVTIGPLRVHDVSAVVMPEGALSENLLGMSFLSRLRRFEVRSGRLELEQ
jgi:aspartyl protease family protein